MTETPRRAKLAIEREAAHLLRMPTARRNPTLRNGAVRVLVALLPVSLPTLEEMMLDFSRPMWHEIHFELFATLVWHGQTLDLALRRRLIALIRSYLNEVRSDAGYAAFTAGCLLGEEWGNAETCRVLEDVALGGRYAAGRSAAIHGLEHAFGNSGAAARARIRTVLRSVAHHDVSSHVRSQARLASQGLLLRRRARRKPREAAAR